ncbi:hypothetical protein GCM10022222_51210 [Amycolatopsis ultiminotia]|uniref:Uncharacterized protein n=1 Tax=Amycolatopsis ultiminotia TaxID=543629 RepID=A0ABP6X466_9PSEU
MATRLDCGAAGTLKRVSHEAICQWACAQPVATLRAELIRLRTGRTRRSSYDRLRRPGSANRIITTSDPRRWRGAP